MLQPFATIDDLRAHWSGLPLELEDEAEQKLIEGSIIIRGLYPDVDARLASGRLKSETVQLVLCQMVATLIKREMEGDGSPVGDDVTQQTFSAGPYSQSLSFRVREAELFLSRMHKLLLSGGGARNRKAFMIIPKP